MNSSVRNPRGSSTTPRPACITAPPGRWATNAKPPWTGPTTPIPNGLPAARPPPPAAGQGGNQRPGEKSRVIH